MWKAVGWTGLEGKPRTLLHCYLPPDFPSSFQGPRGLLVGDPSSMPSSLTPLSLLLHMSYQPSLMLCLWCLSYASFLSILVSPSYTEPWLTPIGAIFKSLPSSDVSPGPGPSFYWGYTELSSNKAMTCLLPSSPLHRPVLARIFLSLSRTPFLHI